MSTCSGTFSFELFPPRTPKGAESFPVEVAKLAQAKPAFFSVTFGAGGTTREGTKEAVLEIQAKHGIEAAPHLSCMAATRAELATLIHEYKARGIRRIVALRGDKPQAGESHRELQYADELVRLIRDETGDHFHIEVAVYPEYHPESPTPESDFQNFRRKVEAGADSAITQYFFNADAYFDLLERCDTAGLNIPVTPGIMPITNYAQLARFSDACGAEIPRWIRKRLENYDGDLASIRAFGLDVVTGLCEELLAGGAPGIHFYTLNQSEPTLALWQRLGLG
ncbi:MAG: methylenetetrahydrofolate reductase [NAD(P)H] [Nevskiales bacterium]